MSMEIITTLEELKSKVPTAVAIGKFDGVHAGHRLLLSEILSAAQDGLCPCVFTFEPSPERIFGGGDVKLLSTRRERREALEALGIGLLIEYPLDRETASVEPAYFIEEFLCRRLKAGLVAAGADLSFGAGGKGDFALLNALRHSGGYETKQVEKLMCRGSAISSSRVRALVEAGEMEEAEECLGSPYSVSGTVQHGAGLGHSLGFPTLNVIPGEDKLLPPRGVYEGEVLLRGRKYRALTNIGTKPTVQKEGIPAAEAYLYDYEGDAYGEEIRIELKHFRRAEKRFESIEELKEQLRRDIEGK
ncbi:MAG: riboflavin biosynthesis protein RibF [Lachnospiraceae bacterium]|nr:riboflavin biosynthesis protein RibF [Lachnospiraceae bacterium]